MSQRGSFVSEYIYCKECAKSLKEYFDSNGFREMNKYFYVEPIYSTDDDIVIFSGKNITTGYESVNFQMAMKDCQTCHPVDFILFTEQEGLIKFTFDKDGIDYEYKKYIESETEED